MDIRGASDMRTLKAISILFCAGSFVAFVWGVHNILIAPINSALVKDSIRGTLVSAALGLFWAGAFYGIHKRLRVTWTLGWCVIVGLFLLFLVRVLPSTTRLPEKDNPVVASAAAVIGDSIVALYWGIWWKRQRCYFDAGRS